MRDPLNLPDEALAGLLREQYGLEAVEITFLPQGGDINSALYRVTTRENGPTFLKLLRGVLDETSVRVPRFLKDLGVRQVISPIATLSRQLWTRLEGFHVLLYPFIAGQNAFAVDLTENQWAVFGAALRRIHAAGLPPELERLVQREAFSPQWRERVSLLMERAQTESFADPIAAQYAGLLTAKAEEIQSIVEKAGRLGAALSAQPPPFVLCHTDLHAGNLLVDADGSLFIIDWDHPLLAPKERDLMFIGGGIGTRWYSPQEEELFYQGYGPPEIDPLALAYYRFERIIQDIAEWGQLVLFTDNGGKERARALQGLVRWFSPHDVVDMAYQAAENLPPGLRSALG